MANTLVNRIRDVLGRLYPNDACINKKAQTLINHTSIWRQIIYPL